MARVAIFDLDGTLIDSRVDLAQAGNVARASVGLPPLPLEQVVGYVGDGLHKLIERLIPDASTHAHALVAFSDYYDSHCCDETQPYVGMLDVLKTLKRDGWQLAVATNKPGRFTRAILSGLGLDQYFTWVYDGDGPRKPDPSALLSIMEQAQCQASDAWMIGDHQTDIRAGHAAQCRVAYCAWGFGQRDELPVDVVVDAPRDLPSALQVSGTA